MYKQYEAATLRKVQMTEKQILVKFITICQKFNLRYFVTYGTLLGTIRHQGFIPWDDDIDVGMPRSDYERFLDLAQQECGDDFFVQTIETDEKYHLYFAKLRMKNTRFIENSLQSSESVSGFYIDIFPYDVVPDDNKQMKKYNRHAVIMGMLLSVNKVKEPQIGEYSRCVELIMKGIWKILHYGMKILGIKGETLWGQCLQVFRKYEYTNYKRVTTFSPEADKWVIYLSEIETLIDKQFENILVKVPKDYENVLRRYYGDYMQLPPEGERINHVPVEIQFPGDVEIIKFEE